jgi:hypothetical protein
MQILISLTLFLIALYIMSISIEFIKKIKINTVLLIFLIIFVSIGWICWGSLGYEDKNDKHKEYFLKECKMYKIQKTLILEFKDLSKIYIELNDTTKNLDYSEMKFIINYHYNLYNILIDSTLTVIKK